MYGSDSSYSKICSCFSLCNKKNAKKVAYVAARNIIPSTIGFLLASSIEWGYKLAHGPDETLISTKNGTFQLSLLLAMGGAFLTREAIDIGVFQFYRFCESKKLRFWEAEEDRESSDEEEGLLTDAPQETHIYISEDDEGDEYAPLPPHYGSLQSQG